MNVTRNTKPPDIRKQELIEIALKQYMTQGYEGTSIRTITKEAGGGTGMFYHYFNSKNDIYEAALQLYNQAYLERVSNLLADQDLSFQDKMDTLCDNLEVDLPEYRKLYTDRANPDVMIVLLTRTLNKMVPMLQPVVISYMTDRGAAVPDEDQALLVRHLLFGMSGVNHAPEIEDISYKSKMMKRFFHLSMERMIQYYRES